MSVYNFVVVFKNSKSLSVSFQKYNIININFLILNNIIIGLFSPFSEKKEGMWMLLFA